jgi:hypothetical protein
MSSAIAAGRRAPEPWSVWSQWLALRGLGLVPDVEPKTFNWPGPWLAVLAGPEEDVAALAFESPPAVHGSCSTGRRASTP